MQKYVSTDGPTKTDKNIDKPQRDSIAQQNQTAPP